MAETWVAEEDGEVVGFISLLNNYIGALFIKPSWQGQLVGTKLVNQVTKIKDTLTVGVKKNQKARQFYEKHGFIFVNEEMQEETGEIIQNMIRKTGVI